MLSENIRSNRKKMNLSQDELAEKIGVSRQSVSFWETGQTQPTIDNIIALSKIFNISSDVLLGNNDGTNNSQDKTPEDNPNKKKIKMGLLVAVGVAIAAIISVIIFAVVSKDGVNNDVEKSSVAQSGASEVIGESNKNNFENVSDNNENPDKGSVAVVSDKKDFDLFTYCKEFAIGKGTLNGDYCIYQQPATKYSGYDNEYFSISYWADSNMVEFCLHCPLDETLSHNFYLRMRGGYNGKYEYTSSKYYRDTGESFRFAMGYIDPAVFSANYPINCEVYEGDSDGQNQFMENTRIGMCDLINCLKNFVTVEKMECDFSNFDFVNF